MNTLVKQLTTLGKRRKTRTVTSDDAQRLLDRVGYPGNRNLIGGVLRSHFKSVGFTRSTRPSNRGRTIRVWKVPTTA